MAGASWYLSRSNHSVFEVRDWCKDNLTEETWVIDDTMAHGVFEVCVGIEEEAVAFKLMWL